MSRVDKFKFITEEATEVKSTWSCADVLSFHYFNQNGLVYRKQVNDESIRQLVEAGLCKNGSILAHGSLATFEVDNLIKCWSAKRKEVIRTRVAIKMLRDHCKNQEQFIQKICS